MSLNVLEVSPWSYEHETCSVIDPGQRFQDRHRSEDSGESTGQQLHGAATGVHRKLKSVGLSHHGKNCMASNLLRKGHGDLPQDVAAVAVEKQRCVLASHQALWVHKIQPVRAIMAERGCISWRWLLRAEATFLRSCLQITPVIQVQSLFHWSNAAPWGSTSRVIMWNLAAGLGKHSALCPWLKHV